MENEPSPFDQTMKKIEPIFRVAGINIKSGEQTTNRLKSRIIYIINFVWLTVNSFGAIYWFIDGIKTGKDFLELTYIAPCISFSIIGNFKGFFLILYEKQAHMLIENIRKLEREEKRRPQSLKKKNIVEEEKKFINIIIDKFSILFAVVVVLFALIPVMIMFTNYYKTKEVELVLPFMVLYPFDPYQIKVWPFVYLKQLWAACVVTLNISSADYFFFACCTYIRIQFRLLQEDLQTFIANEKNLNEKIIEDEEMRNNLTDLIHWHQNLIESANILEFIYSKSTLLNFITSSLIICLTGFNVTMMTNDIAFLITFLTFLTMSLVQVFFLCFFADLLMDSSMGVSEAVYNSSWYMAETKIAKKLLVVLIRAQRPCKITGFGFTDVNLYSFMRVLSTAYSYFALLKTMYDN